MDVRAEREAEDADARATRARDSASASSDPASSSSTTTTLPIIADRADLLGRCYGMLDHLRMLVSVLPALDLEANAHPDAVDEPNPLRNRVVRCREESQHIAATSAEENTLKDRIAHYFC